MLSPRSYAPLLAGMLALTLRAGAALGTEPAPLTLPPPRPVEHHAGPPAWLPNYDLDMNLELDKHQALVHMRVTWTNRHQRPASEIVLNAHSHYKIPGGVGLLAKTVELLRNVPGDAIDSQGHALDVHEHGIHLGDAGGEKGTGPLNAKGPVPFSPPELPFYYTDPAQVTDEHFAGGVYKPTPTEEEYGTALVIPLPKPVGQGESVTLDIDFTMHLPQKQGRWGQWQGVTFLATWVPVLAFYDDHGWQPTPFIPWHQPFFNEAGNYTARVTLP